MAKKAQNKQYYYQENFEEDEDCLVNIVEEEDNAIEIQPTLTHPRQNDLYVALSPRDLQNKQ